jgi:hypothetical protein
LATAASSFEVANPSKIQVVFVLKVTNTEVEHLVATVTAPRVEGLNHLHQPVVDSFQSRFEVNFIASYNLKKL